MRVGVLGPLRVEVAGHPVEVGGRLPRRLLATLVAHAGETVSTDALVDAVWGDRPPPSAVKTLQAYVTRLRAALSGGHAEGAGVIRTAPPGYRLVVPPEVVDATVFVDLIRRARPALDEADTAAADRLLTEALNLWRGPPYGEFADLDVGVAEARRLEEVRLSGLEMRLDVGLLAGRYAEVVAEAEALCAAHPVRERFCAQLMTALYRSGRQADALAAYQRVRTLLADEVGADPGPALRLLEQQVLRQDAALDGSPPPVPAAPADTPPTTVAQERRVATVLVAGIGPVPGDDAWADPEVAVVRQERFQAICAEVVAATGGAVIDRTGHGVTAAFGVLVAHDDHVARALHAALALRERCDRSLGAMYAGVATGEVLRRAGGPDGTSASGEPVRLAAGLRHAAGPGEVLVGERAAVVARRRFTLTAAADRAAGGAPPLPAALLIASRPAGFPPTRTFVGRGDELDALDAAYRRVVAQRRPLVVHLYGEAGIGKSTLVARALDRLRDIDPAATVHVGHCLAYGQGTIYGALAEILRAYLALNGEAPADLVRQRLAGREILGLTLGLDTDLDPRDARELLHTAWVALVDSIVTGAPAVFVIEDLHWAWQPLMDLVTDLVAGVAGPLLIVATARPEYAEEHPIALGPRRQQQVFWLEGLTDEQAGLMLRELLGRPPDEALRRRVLGPAEGNPFLIEELLGTLRDRGLLVPAGDGWRLADRVEATALPDTVRSALATRVDCLGPDARATLLAAAVAGRIFAAAPVARLLDPAHPDFEELVDRDLIRRQRGRPPAFAFKHALTRQVAYDLLPAGRRARLHAVYADILAEAPDDLTAVLAHHYAEAARPDLAEVAWAEDAAGLARVRERAFTWLAKAAELAVSAFAIDEALALVDRALALTPPPRTETALWRLAARGDMLRLDYPAHQVAMERALRASDDPEQQAEAYAEMAAAITDWGVISSALPSDETVEGWMERALALAAPGTHAHTLALLIRSAWMPHHLAELAPLALAAAEHGDHVDNLLEAYGSQEVRAGVERRYTDVLDWSMKRIAVVDSDDPFLVGDMYIHPIPSLMALGRFAEAREFAARNEEVAERQGRTHVMHAVSWWIEIETLAGEWTRVRDLEERARSGIARDEAAHRVSTIRALLLCAAARANLHDPGGAGRLERLADDLAGGHDDRIEAPHIRLALARHDLDRVAELLGRAPRQLRPWAQWWALDYDVTRLDAFAALGDEPAVNAEVAPLLGTSPFLDAVAWRALGTVRRDPALRQRAVDAFLQMGLPGQAAVVFHRGLSSRPAARAEQRRRSPAPGGS